MAKQTIYRGATPNDNTGDNLRVGAGKINDNFNEIYDKLGDGSNILFNYNTYKLTEVKDVTAPMPSHDQIISWDSVTSQWINKDKLSGNVVGHMIPTDANNTWDLGSQLFNFRDIYLAGNAVFNPGEQRIFSDNGVLKLQYDQEQANTTLFDDNESTVATITPSSPTDDIYFSNTEQMDVAIVSGTPTYFLPGIDYSSSAPYSLLPNIIVELTLSNTVTLHSNTYTNYDETAFGLPDSGHEDAFYFSGPTTVTLKTGTLPGSSAFIETDAQQSDVAHLVIKQTYIDGIGEFVITNKTQTLTNKTIRAANNSIVMSIGDLVDVSTSSGNTPGDGDILTWKTAENRWTPMMPEEHPISGAVVNGDLLPTANAVYSLGSPTAQFKDLYLSGATLNIGGISLSEVSGGLSISKPIVQSSTAVNLVVYEDERDLGTSFNSSDSVHLSKLSAVNPNWSDNIYKFRTSIVEGQPDALLPFLNTSTGTVTFPYLTNDPTKVASSLAAGYTAEVQVFDNTHTLIKTFSLIDYASDITTDDVATNTLTIDAAAEGLVLTANRTFSLVAPDEATLIATLSAANGGGYVKFRIFKNDYFNTIDEESYQELHNKILGNVSRGSADDNLTLVAGHIKPYEALTMNIGGEGSELNRITVKELGDEFGGVVQVSQLFGSSFLADAVSGSSPFPTSSTSTGKKGEIHWDDNYIYICVSTNQWHRLAADNIWT